MKNVLLKGMAVLVAALLVLQITPVYALQTVVSANQTQEVAPQIYLNGRRVLFPDEQPIFFNGEIFSPFCYKSPLR